MNAPFRPASGSSSPGGAVELLLVRHGESAGNVAATAAQRTGAEVIDIGLRDADVPLTDRGVEQATAFGASLTARGSTASPFRPEVVWSSPYLRARQTADHALREAGLDVPVRVDERLRDRELGILDLLTATGVEARFPAEAARRRWWGKFYYRPPGGESWVDVAARLRSLLRDIDDAHPGGRILVVAHDAVILLIRYVCEQLTEDRLLEIATTNTVMNASATQLIRPEGVGIWQLGTFNTVEHLEQTGAPVTRHSGDTDARPR